MGGSSTNQLTTKIISAWYRLVVSRHVQTRSIDLGDGGNSWQRWGRRETMWDLEAGHVSTRLMWWHCWVPGSNNNSNNNDNSNIQDGAPSSKWVYKPIKTLLTIVVSTIKPLIRQLSYLGGPILYSNINLMRTIINSNNNTNNNNNNNNHNQSHQTYDSSPLFKIQV